MATPNKPIRVPKASSKSFHKDRPIPPNSLLAKQVLQIRALEEGLLKQLQKGIRFEDVKTEGDAAAYIRRITAVFHPHLVRKGGK